ncbi:energy transducer TonB [Lacinutrix jangbogonensis]|uniref:energy transducer TonB n=1 Tax=Lacinutrix jangbogonensis TaxID=1469557 RepID=UPI00053DC864|nr:energy transducer TonB [Lacinutrix jangbogonensis]
MNNSKKSRDLVRQNEKNVQKSQKHDANLQKNSTLYFQVGLILCLLASYGALEMSFASNGNHYDPPKEMESEDFVYVMPNFKVIKEVQPEKNKVTKKLKAKAPVIKIVDNHTKVLKPVDAIVDVFVPDNKIAIISTDDPSLIIDDVDPVMNIMAVQKVPIFPGCEKETTNNGRRKCLSSKLTKLVRRKFDTDVAIDLGLTGKQKIVVSFKINKLGEVEIIETRANHKALKIEANRVIGKIPTMEPGKNNDRPVEVSYMLPIQFNIQ